MSVDLMCGDFQLAMASYAGCEHFPIFIKQHYALPLRALQCQEVARYQSVCAVKSLLELLENWDTNLKSLLKINNDLDNNKTTWWQDHARPLSDYTLGAPIIPRQIFCTIGNYVSGAIQANQATQTPSQTLNTIKQRRQSGTPYICVKLPSAVTGPFDKLNVNDFVEQADWEVELAVIIGQSGQNILLEDAFKHIAGYTIANDITARDFVNRTDISGMGTDWLRAKCSPGYLPLGPVFTPAPFIADPKSLELCLRLNGKVMQQEYVADMIFDIAQQITYLSRYISLEAGDVICTGSPAGFGLHYQRFLSAGDIVEASISGLGSQRNEIHAKRY